MDKPHNISAIAWNAVIRIAWGVICLSHVYWLARSFGSSEASLIGQLTLGPTCVFLALKTVNVSFLRFNCTRQALIAAVLVVVLMHVGVIDRHVGDSTSVTPWVLPVVLGVMASMRPALIACIRRVITRVALAFGYPCPHWTRHFWHIVAGMRIRGAYPAFITVRTPRAPPL